MATQQNAAALCHTFPQLCLYFEGTSERFTVRAFLHGTTLSHATSLLEAYDMTWNHLQAHEIYNYDMPSCAIPLCKTGGSNKQNSRFLASFGPVIIAIICTRRKNKRKVKEVLGRERLRRRTEPGVYRQLLEELRLNRILSCIIFEIVLVLAIQMYYLVAPQRYRSFSLILFFIILY